MVQEHKLDYVKIEAARRMYIPEGETFWTAADETKGGVAITVRSGRGIQVVSQGQDTEGRFIWVVVEMGDRTFGLCNVCIRTLCRA